MAETADTPQGGTPPWLPFKTFLNFIEWLGEVGVPQRIDRNFWARKLAGNMGPLVINALQFFDLIDENSYSKAALDEIAQDTEKRKEFFARQLRGRYGDVLKAVNLERATRNQLTEEFSKAFGVKGSVQTKAVIFFVYLARFAGASVSSHIIIRERKESAKPRKKKNQDQQTPPPPGEQAKTEHPSAMQHPDIKAKNSLLLWGLFQRLPEPGAVWPEAERKQWLDTLQNVFTLEYKNS